MQKCENASRILILFQDLQKVVIGYDTIITRTSHISVMPQKYPLGGISL
jgi:hypothetical protein